jgi:hypothetical protein
MEHAEEPIVVPKELHNPHKLVSEASRLLRGRMPQEGFVSCWGTSCLDIAVSPASLGRALRIMNALVLALEKRGFRVEVTRPLSYEERQRSEREAPDNSTRVMVSGEWIEFGLTEKRSVTHPPAPEPPRRLRGRDLESWISANRPRDELVANGRLELNIKNGRYLGVRTTWHDGTHKVVENCLTDFVARLQPMADAMKQHRERLERAVQERREEERRRWEAEQRRREQGDRAKQLEEILHRWRLARDARDYVAEVRGVLSSAMGAMEEGEMEAELRWAEAFAASIDPVAQIRDAIELRLAGAVVGRKGRDS